jgi:hypothetical protein
MWQTRSRRVCCSEACCWYVESGFDHFSSLPEHSIAAGQTSVQVHEMLFCAPIAGPLPPSPTLCAASSSRLCWASASAT